MNYIQRISTALDTDTETVSVLAHLPVARLNTKLQLIKKQIASARKYEQYDAIELLHIWEDQIINAKALKLQLNLEENTTVDVNMELPELAAFDMIERRQDLLKEKLLKDEFSMNGKK